MSVSIERDGVFINCDLETLRRLSAHRRACETCCDCASCYDVGASMLWCTVAEALVEAAVYREEQESRFRRGQAVVVFKSFDGED